jgi:hypothetical protein
VVLDQWIGLIFLVVAAGLYFAGDLLLWPVFYAFGGMMETSKSHPLVHVGIALALGGPVLIALTLILASLCAHVGFWWSARCFGVASLLLFLSWVMGGIFIGIAKSRLAAKEQVAAPRTEPNK